MRNFLLSTAAILMAGQRLPPPRDRLSRPKARLATSCSSMALSSMQSSWKPVADILSKQGYNVTLVENPLTSLAADVEATKQALAKQNGKTVLVGHSWGGVVITEAGNDPKVSALVYVSAFAPDVGQSLATLAASGPPTEGERRFIRMPRATSISTPRCFLRRSRQTCRCRSPSPWRTPSFR